jgi:hypothetical protein
VKKCYNTNATVLLTADPVGVISSCKLVTYIGAR